MHTRRQARRGIAVILAVVATVTVAVGGAAAHRMTVDPKGTDPVRTDEPISQPWAAAHCKAAAPGIVYDSSGGVVLFSPKTVLC